MTSRHNLDSTATSSGVSELIYIKKVQSICEIHCTITQRPGCMQIPPSSWSSSSSLNLSLCVKSHRFSAQAQKMREEAKMMKALNGKRNIEFPTSQKRTNKECFVCSPGKGLESALEKDIINVPCISFSWESVVFSFAPPSPGRCTSWLDPRSRALRRRRWCS